MKEFYAIVLFCIFVMFVIIMVGIGQNHEKLYDINRRLRYDQERDQDTRNNLCKRDYRTAEEWREILK